MLKKWICFTCFVLVPGPALTSTTCTEIVGWWKFDEGSGTIAQDSSRCNNDVFFNDDPQRVTREWIFRQSSYMMEVECYWLLQY